MTIEMLEQRLAVLEEKYVDLQHELAVIRSPMPNGADWTEEICGAMDDHPEWEDVVRLGQEWRHSFHAPSDKDE